jgi:chorismate mutase
MIDALNTALIERAMFAYNPKLYQKGAFEELTSTGFEGSWLEWFLKETESVHGKSSLSLSLSLSPACKGFPQETNETLLFTRAAKMRRYER